MKEPVLIIELVGNFSSSYDLFTTGNSQMPLKNGTRYMQVHVVIPRAFKSKYITEKKLKLNRIGSMVESAFALERQTNQ